MIEPIKLSQVSSKEKESQQQQLVENFSIDIFNNKKHLNQNMNDLTEAVFTEAFFANGKAKMKPIEDQFQVIKDKLTNLIKDSDSGGKTFNPAEFVKDESWKELENRMMEIFGFRNVEIFHTNEKHISNTIYFDNFSFNCTTYMTWRYPIQGLVTDDGFYDSTKSINTTIYYTLGLIHLLSADELTAIFLHELGHNLDPALVDIKYTEVNILSKYLTDRETNYSSEEKKYMAETGQSVFHIIIGVIVLGGLLISGLLEKIIPWSAKKTINDVKEAIKKKFVESPFNRRQHAEAFADNFARMYGYGASLISGFGKVEHLYAKNRKSRIQNEKIRQQCIIDLTIAFINSGHQTDIHRIHTLIKEYNEDLKDPNIPDKVKKDIQTDLNELLVALKTYLNSQDKLVNNMNKVILEEIKKLDIDINKPINESVEDIFTEKKKVIERLPINAEERADIIKKFGDSNECSWARDKDGIYCYTHRCRSKSYETVDDIPKGKVNFVRSTS